MAKLELRLLGTPVISYAGIPLRFATRKAKALLIYLAVEGGMQPREKLIAFFFPDSAASSARAAFRNTLARLRTALDESGANSEYFLLSDGDMLTFNRDQATLDTELLETALTTAPTQGQDRFDALRAAVDGYRGDFLEGFTLDDTLDFDDWASFHREHYQQRFGDAASQLVRWLVETGDTSGAANAAERWVKHDPLNEAAHRGLMQARFAAGDREGALRAYRVVEAVLQGQLGVSPGPETGQLGRQIEQMAVPMRPARRDVQHPLEAIRFPLIGRAEPFAQLVTAYRETESGHLRLCLLEGEAGVGKTRLVTEFLQWTSSEGAEPLSGRALEAGGNLPYHLWLDALRTLQARVDWRDLLGEVWLTELSRLLPDVRERCPDLPLPISVTEAEGRGRVFEAVVQVGQTLADRKPLVLWFDDIQWIDAASLDLLQYAVRRWTDQPVLVILTLRGENTAKYPLAALERETVVRRLTLANLQLEDVTRMLASLAPATSPPLAAFVRWLYEETQGQPFFVLETLKALVEEGILKPYREKETGWVIDCARDVPDPEHLHGLLPRGIRNLVLARLAHLTAPAFELLVAGAVLGQPLNYRRLCQVANLSEESALDSLDELLKNRLLLEQTTTEESYLFSHDKIRAIVYAEAGAARRRLFHGRAYEVLQQERASSAALAYHALQGGLPDIAARLSLEAGDEALRLFAVADAILHFEQALRLSSEKPASIDRTALYQHLGRAYELAGRWPDAEHIYRLMLAEARAEDQLAAEGLALNHLALLVIWTQRDLAAASALVEEADEIAIRFGDRRALAESTWTRAQLEMYLFSLAAVPHGEQALARAREVADGDLLVRSLITLAHAQINQGEWEAAFPLAQEAAECCAALHNRALEVEALTQAAIAQVNCGLVRQALETARRAHRVSREIDNAWGETYSSFPLVSALIDLDDVEAAEPLARRAFDLAQNLPALQLLSLGSMAAVSFMQGRYELSLGFAEQAQAINAAAAQSSALAELLAGLSASAYAASGKWELAGESARRAVALGQEHSSRLAANRLWWIECEALLRGGDVETARASLERCRLMVRGNLNLQIVYLRMQAVHAAWFKDFQSAHRHLNEALELAHQANLVIQVKDIQRALSALPPL